MSQKRPPLFRGRHFQDVIILLCVRWYLRYSLSCCDLEEMMTERSLSVDHVTIWRWVQLYAPDLSPLAFVPALAGQQGDLGRNVLRGFGAWQADLGLQRHFQLSERTVINFRGEFFNVFNHPNFGSPNNILTSPLFGQSTQTLANSLAGGNNAGFNRLYQIGGPRAIQLALKLRL